MRRVPAAPPPPPPPSYEGAATPKASPARRESAPRPAPADPYAPPKEPPPKRETPKPPPVAVKPTPVSHEPLLGSRGSRFVAQLIDSGVVLFSLVPGYAALMVLGRGWEWLGLALMLVCFLSGQGYQWWGLATAGQTIGKRSLGIQVERINGEPPSFWRMVVLRIWAIGTVQAIPGGALVSFVDSFVIFGAEQRCLHDYLAGTRVVVAYRA